MVKIWLSKQSNSLIVYTINILLFRLVFYSILSITNGNILRIFFSDFLKWNYRNIMQVEVLLLHFHRYSAEGKKYLYGIQFLNLRRNDVINIMLKRSIESRIFIFVNKVMKQITFSLWWILGKIINCNLKSKKYRKRYLSKIILFLQ